MINSFVTSTDYSELKQLLHQLVTNKKCKFLYSVVVSDKNQLLRNIKNTYMHSINVEMCENITMYDHYDLNDLSIIPSFVATEAVLEVEDSKKCSFKTDILNSIPNTITSFSLYTKNTSAISKFDILKALLSNDNHFFSENAKIINEIVVSSESVKNNTNNDKYSKFIKCFEITTISNGIHKGSLVDVKCSVVTP